MSKNREYIEAKGQVVPKAKANSQAEVSRMSVHVCSKVAVNLAMDLSTSPHGAVFDTTHMISHVYND